MYKQKLVIVDDHKIVRDGIRAMLAGNRLFSVTADLASGRELFELLRSQQPDIVVLDIGMPEMDGVQITERLSIEYPSVKALILTANATEEWIVAAVKAGAMGFLPKDCSREEFIKALSYIGKEENYYGQSVAAIVYRSYVAMLKKKQNPQPPEQLTERESEVLKAFSEGLTFKEIADQLSISVRTVETHKNNILCKLKLRNTVDMVKYAIKNGIITI